MDQITPYYSVLIRLFRLNTCVFERCFLLFGKKSKKSFQIRRHLREKITSLLLHQITPSPPHPSPPPSSFSIFEGKKTKKYQKFLKNTIIISLKSRKILDNKMRFEKINRSNLALLTSTFLTF